MGMNWGSMTDWGALGLSAAGAGASAKGAAKSAAASAQAQREQQQQDRNQLALLQGPNKAQMAAIGAMKYTPTTYTPGQGYSNNTVNLAEMLAAASPYTNASAQAGMSNQFAADKATAMEDPRLSMMKGAAEHPVLFQPTKRTFHKRRHAREEYEAMMQGLNIPPGSYTNPYNGY